MKPRELVHQWIDKADQDFEAAVHLLDEGPRFREVIAFHAQQAVEKYLKALLVRREVDFPKTHDIARLLEIIATFDAATATELQDADTLTPFCVELRYPGDLPQLLPGEELDAVALARQVRDRVLRMLADDAS